MTNQYGVSREDNDRLLELMGGCRHAYLDGRGPWPSCVRCGRQVGSFVGGPGGFCVPLPAVGDGHDVTLGEMVRLCIRLERKLGGLVTVEIDCDEPGWTAVLRWDDSERTHYHLGGPSRDHNTPEAALCAAILAAKAKE